MIYAQYLDMAIFAQNCCNANSHNAICGSPAVMGHWAGLQVALMDELASEAGLHEQPLRA